MEELTIKINKYFEKADGASFNLGNNVRENILIYEGFNYSKELNDILLHIYNLPDLKDFNHSEWVFETDANKLEKENLVDKDLDFYLKYLFSLFCVEKNTEGAIASAEKKGILEIIFISIINLLQKKNHYWETLSTLELGKFSEYYAKMELLKNGLQVFQTEVDDRGIDFIAKSENKYLEIQVKSVRLKTTSYVFLTKTEKFFLRDGLFICLIIYFEALQPHVYLIPSLDLDINNGLFVFRTYEGENLKSKPEWGINLTKKHLIKLEIYRIDLALTKFKLLK